MSDLPTPEEVAKEFLGGFDPHEWSFLEKDIAQLIRDRDKAVRESMKEPKGDPRVVVNYTPPEPKTVYVPVPGHPRYGDRR